MKIAYILPFIPFFLSAMEIPKENLFIPSSIHKVAVIKAQRDFIVEQEGKYHIVQSDRLDSSLRIMNNKQLAKFFKNGYVAVNQSTDGSYSLAAHKRLRGGGPILAYLFYGTTKAVCWGAVMGATVFIASKVVKEKTQNDQIINAVNTLTSGVTGAVGNHTLGGTMANGLAIPINIAKHMNIVAGMTSTYVSSNPVVADGVAHTTVAVGISGTASAALSISTAIETISVAAGYIGGLIPWF